MAATHRGRASLESLQATSFSRCLFVVLSLCCVARLSVSFCLLSATSVSVSLCLCLPVSLCLSLSLSISCRLCLFCLFPRHPNNRWILWLLGRERHFLRLSSCSGCCWIIMVCLPEYDISGNQEGHHGRLQEVYSSFSHLRLWGQPRCLQGPCCCW